MTTKEQYREQLMQMAGNAHRWRLANLDKEVLVQFNFPPQMALIAPISEAIKNKFVTTNEAGLELVKALWPWDTDKEPTVLMVRTVLETPAATESKNPNPLPESVCPACGYKTDASTCMREKDYQPRPGDITVCIKCGEVGEFDRQLRVKEATLETMMSLDTKQFTDLTRLQKLVREKRMIP